LECGDGRRWAIDGVEGKLYIVGRKPERIGRGLTLEGMKPILRRSYEAGGENG